MTILLILIPISLVLLGIAVGAFCWAVRSGQFDDLHTPGVAILADERRRDACSAAIAPVGAASAAIAPRRFRSAAGSPPVGAASAATTTTPPAPDGD